MRGTVVVGVAGREEDQWCAACAAVDGMVELRVASPPRRGLLRRGDRAAEAWLREHGFVPVIDAWSLPATADDDASCATILETALTTALGAEPDASLVPVLTHPGLPGAAEPPPADARLEEHLTTALRSLADAGQGRFHVESGRPAELRAFAWALDGELVVEREVPGVAESPGETWTEPLTPDGAWRAAAELARRVREERSGADSEPWFLTFVAPET